MEDSHEAHGPHSAIHKADCRIRRRARTLDRAGELRTHRREEGLHLRPAVVRLRLSAGDDGCHAQGVDRRSRAERNGDRRADQPARAHADLRQPGLQERRAHQLEFIVDHGLCRSQGAGGADRAGQQGPVLRVLGDEHVDRCLRVGRHAHDRNGSRATSSSLGPTGRARRRRASSRYSVRRRAMRGCSGRPRPTARPTSPSCARSATSTS